MLNYSWFYYCYEPEDDKYLVFPLWKKYPQINYTTLNYYMHNAANFNSKIDSYLLFSLYSTRSNFFLNTDDDLRKLLPTLLEEEDSQTSVFNTFLSLRKSSFISFFIDNMIDVPICFKKSPSLRNKNFELPILKFSNFLMKKGKREQIFKILINALVNFFKTTKSEKLLPIDYTFSWFEFFIYLNTILSLRNSNKTLLLDEPYDLLYKNLGALEGKIINNDFFLKNYLFSRLSRITPIFSFFVYNVDKNIRKYSRGKSGKYVFIWKYIASYKRLFVAFKWIIKDIKFNNNKTITDRISKSLQRLTTEPQNSFVWRSHQFAHNYVFKNLRKSLMATLKTTS